MEKQVRPIDKLVAALKRTAPPDDETIPVAREKFEKVFALTPPVPGVTVRPDTIAGRPVEWSVPDGADLSRVIVYCHGGGYTTGSLVTIRSLAGYLATRVHTQVLTVDYRLAPEHPHPAALEDVCAVVRALVASGKFKPEQIVMGGDSAGGGLAIATMVALRDAKEPMPAGAFGISPWLDLSLSGESLKREAPGDPFMRLGNLVTMSKAYLAGAPGTTPSASPLFADLRGLPPILLQAGATELIVDDSKRFAERAKVAGVEVKLACWEDMIHVWHMYAPRLPEALSAMDEIGAWLHEIAWKKH